MDINSQTKINDLLQLYPFLEDWLIQQSPKFKNLRNPLMRKTIGKMATVGHAAAMGNFTTEQLMAAIASEVAARSSNQPSSNQAAAEPAGSKQERLKAIIRELHGGATVEDVKDKFRRLVQDVSPTEIAQMEQALVAEGLPETEIKRLCNVHVALFREALDPQEVPDQPEGHPVHTLMRENRIAETIVIDINYCLEQVGAPADATKFRNYLDEIKRHVGRLAAIQLHYTRKENQLFPLLERHDVSAPPQVMWAIHDEIRAMFRRIEAEVAELAPAAAVALIRELLTAVQDMIYKEEHILYPLSLETLSADEWRQVRHGEEEIGYAWLMPPARTWDSGAEQGEVALVDANLATATLNMQTGQLTPAQLDLILTNLPVEITFVGADDRVVFYSLGKVPIFPRSPGIIGRKVQHCHPPESVRVVNKIVTEFKAGDKDTAEFWLEIRGMFVHIRYFAVRDATGAYQGVLEVSQDVTAIRQLEGEKRLLNWE